jgi:hypothetical protein
MWTPEAHDELKNEFVEATSSRRLLQKRSTHKRLFNGTKPISVENKGYLEEQTQTKPIPEARMSL